MKRWLVRICVLLLLGAIVNVAVALVIARKQPPLRLVPSFPDMRFKIWARSDATTADRDWLLSKGWQPTSPGYATTYTLHTWTMRSNGVMYRVVGEVNQPSPPPPTRTLVELERPNIGSSRESQRPSMREISSGWPALALRGRIWNTASWDQVWTRDATWQPQSLIVRSERLQFPGPVPAFSVWILPIRPIWPGFAINTVFYAFILWLLFAAPFALRRRLRIQRGLCPKCAYPIGAWGSDVCTECGAAVTLSSYAR